MTAKAVTDSCDFDVLIIGGGAAGLAAGLNLVRANRRVIIVDSNRPRHAATLRSHGFLTRDGAPPLVFRQLGREEFEGYENATFAQALVHSIVPLPSLEGRHSGFQIEAHGIRNTSDVSITARLVLVAAGLVEELPPLPTIRAYYGTALHSCVECDGFEKSDKPLVMIGETTDVFDRTLLITQFSRNLTVFTNGADTITPSEQSILEGLGVTVERGALDDVVGENADMIGVRLADGRVVPAVGGFVRPRWNASVDYLSEHNLARNEWGLLLVDSQGETSVPGIYAAGDVTPPGPEQLMIACGDGVRVSNKMNMALIRADL
ncbi:NAD(P)/FAD-dependent oxidoreductase [Lysinibacter sp. HNR]|uniref:NAD(P)/FAD-dependent oxidoreductase n=1 Tax=Lysinibacter sp. HNR TaxID=3031408 RepID=UPI002435B797|nr:NAD(P)/FAD-dependent oxidoreductase [Lysinibacter sp. HNR]WGD37864.1 NAD(P)/FAD-dependent oxidoreductase [Lysinibacter sp. HNR]